MFYILVTQDVVTDGVYFSKHVGQLTDTVDPAKKFNQLQLEDGTQSVTTEMYRQFGTKASMNSFYDTDIPDGQKADPVQVEIVEPKAPRPEVAIVLGTLDVVEPTITDEIVTTEKAVEISEVVEDDVVIAEPESTVKKPGKAKK